MKSLYSKSRSIFEYNHSSFPERKRSYLKWSLLWNSWSSSNCLTGLWLSGSTWSSLNSLLSLNTLKAWSSLNCSTSLGLGRHWTRFCLRTLWRCGRDFLTEVWLNFRGSFKLFLAHSLPFFLDITASRKTLVSWNWATLAKNIFYIKMTKWNLCIFSYLFSFAENITHIEKKYAQKITPNRIVSIIPYYEYFGSYTSVLLVKNGSWH